MKFNFNHLLNLTLNDRLNKHNPQSMVKFNAVLILDEITAHFEISFIEIHWQN